MDKRLLCGLIGLGVLVVAAGVVTATVVTKGKKELPAAEEEDEVKELEEAVEE